MSRPFLPLDHDAVVFPGANPEQRLAISQMLGLLINASIAEMEDVIVKLRDLGWEKLLRKYPANPEMGRLGELFFEEEAKHSVAFYRYIDLFCTQNGIDREQMDLLLPKAFGSIFLKTIILNARAGGHAFWWVVAAVEEVSIQLYKDLHHARRQMDPLYHLIHLRHMEEESRHHNYAFLILNLIDRMPRNPKRVLHLKTDLLLAQALSTGWVLGELQKVFHVKKMRTQNRFFRTLDSCLPLLMGQPWHRSLLQLFTRAPYLSLMLNANHHHKTLKMAGKQGAIRFPFPRPLPVVTKAS